MQKTYYIRNTKTDQNYDPNEGKFFGNNWTPEYDDDKEYLQNLIDGDPVKFENCIVEENETISYYVIADKTANSGKKYISEDLSNTGDSDTAWRFATEEEAQSVIDSSGWDWAYIEQI